METANEAAALGFARAITNGDRDAAVAMCHPDIEFVSMIGISGRSYVGHRGIHEYLDDAESAWDEWNVDVERVTEGADGRVAIVMTMRARGKGSGIEVDERTAHVWTLRDGLLLRNVHHREPADALRAIGVHP